MLPRNICCLLRSGFAGIVCPVCLVGYYANELVPAGTHGPAIVPMQSLEWSRKQGLIATWNLDRMRVVGSVIVMSLPAHEE